MHCGGIYAMSHLSLHFCCNIDLACDVVVGPQTASAQVSSTIRCVGWSRFARRGRRRYLGHVCAYRYPSPAPPSVRAISPEQRLLIMCLFLRGACSANRLCQHLVWPVGSGHLACLLGCPANVAHVAFYWLKSVRRRRVACLRQFRVKQWLARIVKSFCQGRP